MREFAEAVMRGDTFDVDPEATKRFRREMENTFGNLKVGAAPTSPSGPAPVYFATAGETPRQ
jgi:hypothetical protein